MSQFLYCNAKCHFAECCYAECRGAIEGSSKQVDRTNFKHKNVAIIKILFCLNISARFKNTFLIIKNVFALNSL